MMESGNLLVESYTDDAGVRYARVGFQPGDGGDVMPLGEWFEWPADEDLVVGPLGLECDLITDVWTDTVGGAGVRSSAAAASEKATAEAAEASKPAQASKPAAGEQHAPSTSPTPPRRPATRPATRPSTPTPPKHPPAGPHSPKPRGK